MVVLPGEVLVVLLPCVQSHGVKQASGSATSLQTDQTCEGLGVVVVVVVVEVVVVVLGG